jgi:hypothetical protein
MGTGGPCTQLRHRVRHLLWFHAVFGYLAVERGSHLGQGVRRGGLVDDSYLRPVRPKAGCRLLRLASNCVLALLFNLKKHASHLSRIRHHQRMRAI